MSLAFAGVAVGGVASCASSLACIRGSAHGRNSRD